MPLTPSHLASSDPLLASSDPLLVSSDPLLASSDPLLVSSGCHSRLAKHQDLRPRLTPVLTISVMVHMHGQIYSTPSGNTERHSISLWLKHKLAHDVTRKHCTLSFDQFVSGEPVTAWAF